MRAVLFLGFVTVALALPAFPNPEFDEFWQNFKTEYGKGYTGEVEEKMRRFNFEKNLRYIINHNYEADLGHWTFRLGMNEHGDMSVEEFAKFMTGYRGVNKTTDENPTFVAPEFMEIPQKVDWREKGYVTPAKDQKQCGSCWAFSATGSLEGQHYRKTGKLVSLSEQNLVDCSWKLGNRGCNGGRTDLAFLYIKVNGGVDTEASYPYLAKEGVCHYKQAYVGATVKGFVNIPKGNEKALQQAVATVGPISVAIDANQNFMFYKSGVYEETECSSVKLNHAVLAVGYGVYEDGQKFWIVKNSWGETWGMRGYILMARDHNNMCGIATDAIYPLV